MILEILFQIMLDPKSSPRLRVLAADKIIELLGKYPRHGRNRLSV